MSNEPGTDVLGTRLTDDERALLTIYESLKAMLARENLAPHVDANVREALAALWQAVNNLALTDERPRV